MRCLSVAAFVALVALQGCSNRDFISPIYDTCFGLSDCVPTANTCEALAVDFAGVTYENAICTVTCAFEGPVAPGCPLALIGRNGSCYPSSIAGGFDSALVCFEPCDFTGDCLLGFQCLGAEGLCFTGAPCPIARNDRICVPGPSF